MQHFHRKASPVSSSSDLSAASVPPAQPAARPATPRPRDPVALIAARVPAFAAALTAHREGRIGAARAAYLDLIDRPGLTAICLYQLALIAGAQGDHVRASQILRQAIQLAPGEPLFYGTLALACEKAGHVGPALDALVEQGVVAQRGRAYGPAAEIYGRVLRRDPNRYAAHINLGHCHAFMDQVSEAARCLIQGLVLAAARIPDLRPFLDAHLPALVAGGLVPPEAAQRAAEPTGVVSMAGHALTSLGKALAELGYADASFDAYRLAVRLEPQSPLAHVNLSLALLLRGELEAGWKEYEWRLGWDRYPEAGRRDSAPLWRDAPLAGKRIGVFAEQGFGDTLQFVPLLQRLKREAAEVIFETPAPLTRLIAHNFAEPGLQVVTGTSRHTGFPAEPPLDYVLPLMSLADRFGVGLQDLPLATSYLAPVPAEVKIWRKRFKPLPGRKIGLAWAGRIAFADGTKRMPGFDALRPLFETEGVSFVSLQLGGEADVAGTSLFDAAPHLGDFADTAAAIAALDLVISIDTATAHLSAAMGRPTWILLRHLADWRWFDDPEQSRWYPYVRLFRQPAAGDWAGAIEAVKAELAAWRG